VEATYTWELASSEEKVTLENWMQRYQAGEGYALEVLVREVSPRLKAIFRGGSPEGEVEELVQETWFQVHRSRHTWRPGELLLPWIYSIARHIRSQSYRKRTRRAEVELDERISMPTPELSYGFEQLLSELPESQREVLILMKVEGRSLEEVAAATGSSVGSVKQKVHRAYEKLRKVLGGEF
jgi:RNA polymerase sigma-70 factor, ECF subfamily